jgi:alkylation response protein AidB-like acyl-CoA dehydrogenase|tara:strand:+ start:3994 stop:5184 length:1191 start_codon:yes stop_codon:yes gene_type:complete
MDTPNPVSQRDILLATADAAASRFAMRVEEIEANSYLPQDIADDLASAGLYRLLTPVEYGGLEISVELFVEIIERLAQTDASAAWCTFISCTSCVLAGYLDPAVSEQLYGKPDLKAAGVFAPRGKAIRETRDGQPGFRVSGRWFWGSATKNADVIQGGCLVLDADGKPELLPGGRPRVQSILFDRSQVTHLNNWDAFGLLGSGSGEFEVDDVFVPEAYSACLMADRPLDRPLYRFPVFGLLGIGIGAVALGVGRHAMDTLIDLAGDKTPQSSSKTLAMRASTQQAVARAEASWRSARAFMLDAVRAGWHEAEKTGEIAVNTRRDIRLATTHAVHSAQEIVSTMYRLGGGNAIFAQSPLQRCLRDIHVITQHFMVSDSTYELTGRLLLGLDTDITML